MPGAGVAGLLRFGFAPDGGATGETLAEVARIGQDEARPMPAVRRRRIAPRSAAVAAALLAATLVGAWWLYDRLTNVYVMDARVASDMILLSSRVAGWVTERPATKGERVAAGAPLLLVDDRQARLRRDELEAALATLDARTDAVKAEIAYMRGATASRIEAAESELVAARSELDAAGSIRETAEDEWRRADALRERNLLSEQDWAARRTAFRTSEQAEKSRAAQLRGAEADVAERRSEQARLDMLDAELTRLESERLGMRLQRDRAVEELADHVIRSPIAGVIDEVFIDAGEYVAEGQRVLMLHDPDVYWVSRKRTSATCASASRRRLRSMPFRAGPTRLRSRGSAMPRRASSRCCRTRIRAGTSPRSPSGSR